MNFIRSASWEKEQELWGHAVFSDTDENLTTRERESAWDCSNRVSVVNTNSHWILRWWDVVEVEDISWKIFSAKIGWIIWRIPTVSIILQAHQTDFSYSARAKLRSLGEMNWCCRMICIIIGPSAIHDKLKLNRSFLANYSVTVAVIYCLLKRQHKINAQTAAKGSQYCLFTVENLLMDLFIWQVNLCVRNDCELDAHGARIDVIHIPCDYRPARSRQRRRNRTRWISMNEVYQLVAQHSTQ